MIIRSERLIARAIEPGDLPKLHEWLNDPDVASGLGDLHFPSSLAQQTKWLERIEADQRSVRLAVQHTDGTLIGYTGFWDIHWRDRRAEHAVIIGDAASRGKGYGREVIMACARYGFEEVGLHRLSARILSTNMTSLKVYQACGYVVEGTLREHALRGGQWIDRVLLGLMAADFGNSSAAAS